MCFTPCMVYNNFNKLKVNGKGSIMAEPDEAVVVLGVTNENVQLELAQRENAEKVAAIISALVALGVPKNSIQTQTYQIQPQYDFVDGKQVFRGYSVIHFLKINVDDISAVGKITDAAVNAGANSVSSIEFIVSDPTVYYKEALSAALSDALSKAASIGMQLKVNVLQIPFQVTEESYQNGPPIPYTTMQAAGPTTPIQPGQIEITAFIEAMFYYACR